MIDGDINIVIAAFCLKCVCAHWGVEVVWQASTHIAACCQRKNEVKSVVIKPEMQSWSVSTTGAEEHLKQANPCDLEIRS